MTNEMLGEYTRVVKTGPPVLACGSVFGNAPRERVFFGNFAAPDKRKNACLREDGQVFIFDFENCDVPPGN